MATENQCVQAVELSLKPGGVSEGTYITHNKSLKGIYSALHTQEMYFYRNLRKSLLKEREIHSAVTG